MKNKLENLPVLLFFVALYFFSEWLVGFEYTVILIGSSIMTELLTSKK